MQLAIFNGSPRGSKSNTAVLVKNFLEGFEGNGGEVATHNYLIKEKQLEEQVANFKKAENIFMAFPLYVDSIPGIVKQFIEHVGMVDCKGKKIIFLVQSGFPEAIHLEGAKKYLEFLTKRWNMELLGIMIKPGGEGTRLLPPFMTKKLFGMMKSFGEQAASGQKLSREMLKALARPYKPSPLRIQVYKLMKVAGLTNFYWNINLRKNKAYHKRDDKPLAS